MSAGLELNSCDDIKDGFLAATRIRERGINSAFPRRWNPPNVSELEWKLPSHFLRADKGCLVNTKKVTSVDITDHKANFATGDFAYMSRRGTKKLYNLLNTDSETNPTQDTEVECG